MIADTAERIADVRASAEAREGVAAFLDKRSPAWAARCLRDSRRPSAVRADTPMHAHRPFDTWQLVALAGDARLGERRAPLRGAVHRRRPRLSSAGFRCRAGCTVLAHPYVLAASGFMFVVEFFADKIPGVDSAWDVVQTFVRIPAGAALAASVFGDAGAATTLAAAILGGSLAAGSHLDKAGSRALINTSPEPFSNWAASFGEELAVGAHALPRVRVSDRGARRARCC